MQQNACPQLQVSWQRVRVANALAVSGEEWVSYLDYLNSGTYNNQCAPLFKLLAPACYQLGYSRLPSLVSAMCWHLLLEG